MYNESFAYFYPMIRKRIDRAAETRGGALLTESAGEELFRAALIRVKRCTAGYFSKLLAELLKDENPFLQYDVNLLTQNEEVQAAPVLTEKLQNGEILLPERIVKNVNVILDHFSEFLESMLDDLTDYRTEICEALFEQETYSRITGIDMAGDTHNYGKVTTIIETDIGKFVYKPHSCQIDAAAYGFMEKYFGGIIVMPKVFAVEDRFGAVEFLQKKNAEGHKQAAAYYHALGGTAAVLKMLGSRDMHMENLFACGEKVALIDIETLLYPRVKGSRVYANDLYSDEDRFFIEDSLIFSCLLNGRVKIGLFEEEYSILLNTGENGSAPVVDGERKSVLAYRKEFFDGFSDYYDRCLERKKEIEEDIRNCFSDCIFRHIVLATRSYGEILQRMNSRFSYSSEEYYQSQISKLPLILKGERVMPDPEIYKQETDALMRQEIPFFHTFGCSHDLYGSERIACRDYFSESCVERSLRILAAMQESEKQFEIQAIRCYLDLAYVKIKDRSRDRQMEIGGDPLSINAATEEAERIFSEIRQTAIPLESGELTWLSFVPGDENPEIMNAGLYSGLSGLAVFFAGLEKLTKKESIKKAARDCLDSSMRSLQRYLNRNLRAEKKHDLKHFDAGEGAGAAGLLRSLVLVNRYQDDRYAELTEAAVSLCVEQDYSLIDKTDKAGGIAGLLSTLCRYEELYENKKVSKLIEILADRLLELKTLECGDVLLWKTLEDKNHPISGAVHGMCGIAEALMLAGKRLGTEKYDEAVKDAMAFEDSAYNEKAGGWEDLRIPGVHKLSGGNCYGPPGMGIIFSRIQKEGITGGVLPRCMMRAGACVGRFQDSGMDHLCCGNMSVVEYYLETGDSEAAGKLLSSVLAHKAKTGNYRLGNADCIPNHNVTLFYGLSGIGYELLRYAEPALIQCVV